MNNRLKHSGILGFLILMLCGVGIWLAAFLLEPGKSPAGAGGRPTGSPAPAHLENSNPIPPPVREEGMEPQPKPSATNQESTSNGEDRISAIIANPNLDFPSAVNRLLEILPGLNETEQEEAAQHISNLSDDKSAAQWAAMLVANQLPAPAAEVLFNDLLNRPQEMTMPILASLSDQPLNPKSQESMEILETLYGQPPQGTKWSAWIKAKLAEEQKESSTKPE